MFTKKIGSGPHRIFSDGGQGARKFFTWIPKTQIISEWGKGAQHFLQNTDIPPPLENSCIRLIRTDCNPCKVQFNSYRSMYFESKGGRIGLKRGCKLLCGVKLFIFPEVYLYIFISLWQSSKLRGGTRYFDRAWRANSKAWKKRRMQIFLSLHLPPFLWVSMVKRRQKYIIFFYFLHITPNQS